MIDKPLVRELYLSGLSTRQTATRLGCSKSQVYKICKDISRQISEAAILRQPATSNHWRSSRAQARRVWSRINGQIPNGFHIHHIDGDHTNNKKDNLECISASDHIKRHWSQGDMKGGRPANPIPRHLRKSRLDYMKSYNKSTKVFALCVYCDKEFRKSKYSKSLTCSHKCGASLNWIKRHAS